MAGGTVSARNGGQIVKELEDLAFIFMGESGEALGIDHTCRSHKIAWEERVRDGRTGGIPDVDRADSGPDR